MFSRITWMKRKRLVSTLKWRWLRSKRRMNSQMLLSSSKTIQLSWMRSWTIKGLHLKNMGFVKTRKPKILKLEHGPVRPQKLVPYSPKMRAKILLTYLQKTSEISKDIKELVLLLKAISEGKQLQDGTKVLGMKVDSMVIILVITLVISLWIVDST